MIEQQARGRVRFAWGVVMIAGAVLLSSCQDDGRRSPAGATSDAAAPPDAGQVAVELVDRKRFDEVIASCHGRVVLVDFWADWCSPCVENLPHVIELADRLRDRGLAVVTVNVNAPEAAEQTVGFLKSRGADGATNLISRYEGASRSMSAFEIPSGLPCYRVYDRRGTLRHTFAVDPTAQRQFTLQDLDAAVEQLLAE